MAPETDESPGGEPPRTLWARLRARIKGLTPNDHPPPISLTISGLQMGLDVCDVVGPQIVKAALIASLPVGMVLAVAGNLVPRETFGVACRQVTVAVVPELEDKVRTGYRDAEGCAGRVRITSDRHSVDGSGLAVTDGAARTDDMLDGVDGPGHQGGPGERVVEVLSTLEIEVLPVDTSSFGRMAEVTRVFDGQWLSADPSASASATGFLALATLGDVTAAADAARANRDKLQLLSGDPRTTATSDTDLARMLCTYRDQIPQKLQDDVVVLSKDAVRDLEDCGYGRWWRTPVPLTLAGREVVTEVLAVSVAPWDGIVTPLRGEVAEGAWSDELVTYPGLVPGDDEEEEEKEHEEKKDIAMTTFRTGLAKTLAQDAGTGQASEPSGSQR